MTEDVATAEKTDRDALHITLHMMLTIAELGASASVTLIIGGTMITGELMSQREYMDTTLSSLAKSFRQSTMSGAAKDFDDMRSALPTGPADKPRPDGSYLFLRNGRVIHGATFTPKNGANWCIRLSSIDGAALGIMKPS